jgi:peptidoglycan/LPS O-acetylase OafA/YrhL
MSPRFYWLDLLRGLAAFGILIFHLSGKTKPLNALYVLVDFFFVLSGFVLYEQIPKKTNFSELQIFIKKRINRLVPTAWFAIIVSYCTYFTFLILNLISPEKRLDINGITFISALFFLQFLIPSSAVLLGPMWSLSVELFMNLLIAIIGVSKKKIMVMALIAVISLSIAVIRETSVIPNSGWVAFSRGFFGFSCGLIARILFNKKNIDSKIQKIVSIVFVSLVFCLISLSNNYLPLAAPAMAYLIYAISASEIKNIRFRAFCIHCGDFSYGIYLWHSPIIFFVDSILSLVNSSNNHYFYKSIELSITLFLSLGLTKIGLILFRKVELIRIN